MQKHHSKNVSKRQLPTETTFINPFKENSMKINETKNLQCADIPGQSLQPVSDFAPGSEQSETFTERLLKKLPDSPIRRYCTFCGKKRNEENLIKIRYKLLNKTAYHCSEHTSNNADILQIISGKKGTFLELFSGSKHISTIAEKYNYKTFTIDLNEDFKPDLAKDIRKVKLTELPKDVSFVWASVPCTVFSILSIKKHWEKVPYSWRKYFYIPKTSEAKRALQIVEKTLWIIKNLNPDYFIIENPRGALRHLPQLRAIPFRHTISYSDYGFDYYKPTDLFTNIPFLKLCEITKDDSKSFAGSVLNLKSAFERSFVPGQLIETILIQIQKHSL